MNHPALSNNQQSPTMAPQAPQIVINNIIIPVEVVSTTEAINKGLGHRRTLEASQGMFFLFDHSAIFKFWMRGMRFPLDIIWIDEHGTIIDIHENVPVVPFLRRAVFYSPSTPARYVLEVNANFCESQGIYVGMHADFKGIRI